MVQSQFSLLWDSYKSNICSGFASLQQNGELVDMTLAADGHFVKVHQVLIALSSSYLKQLILSAPCQHPVIFLNNVSHTTLSLILEYIYTGEVLVPSANLSAFIEAAKALHVKGLETVLESSNNTGEKVEAEVDDANISGTCSIKRETNVSKISLPANARKIFVRHENISNSSTSAKKTWNECNVTEEIPSYSIVMDDHNNDSDDNVNKSSAQSNKSEKPKVTSSNLQFTVSIRGSLQVILNRYIYNLHSTQATGVRRWRCIDYRNKKCSAFLVTKGNVVINRANPHNHSFHDKKIIDKIKKDAVYLALDEVQTYIDNEKAKEREEPMESEFISLELNEGLNNYSEECKISQSIFRGNTTMQMSLLNKMIIVTFFVLLITNIIVCESSSSEYLTNQKQYERNPAIKRLQEYIQIDNSVKENAEVAVEFWRRQAEELGLPYAVHRPLGLPIFVMTWTGRQPELPSIMLNSHADVVPPGADIWNYPPFSGHIDENGNLHGRGSQDTKDVGIQYIEAVRKLIQNNMTLDRTVHITVMPDEETGGHRGMVPFVETEEFKSLNIGFALDEGFTSEDNTMYVTYQDKRPWQIKFIIRGKGGHGSSAANGHVVERLQRLLNIVMEYRNKQMQIQNSTHAFDFGAYTSVNVNMIEGGVAPNVIPTNMTVVMDMRLSVDAEVNEVQDMINSWMAELGDASSLEYIRRVENSPATAVDETNPYWMAMRDTMKELGLTVVPLVCPATSDMVVVRAKAIPALGFTTKRNMIPKLHDVNEYIDLDQFLKGIDIYEALLKKLGNLP
ncbi:aminoacylase-1-like [Vanessa cardui]|uniref:aminoacylase-1-like n=1 Tax=Vanessa cardui TaxID=171605 RepID=UPI001F13AD05|nr:aminoacylase-1-like [Vanessa cardui]